MQMKLSLSTALVASTAMAASSSASIPSSCTISSNYATATAQTDLDRFSGCETLVGNLTITGDLGNAALANIKKIDGSLKIFNATEMLTFAADALDEITGDLTLQQLTFLYSVSFSSLTTIDSINLITLPALTTFTSNLASANSILISDTTLGSVDGFSSLQSVKTFNINNNKMLTSISSSLKNVTDSLQLSSNGEDSVTSFDDLVWANNITLRDAGSVSFGSLIHVNASLGFLNNTITSLNLTKLQSVGQSFSVIANNDLVSLDCSRLTTIGGAFVVANNTALNTINGFSNVTTIGGAMEFIGTFNQLDLSSLKSVKGGADVETNATNFTCSAMDTLHSEGSIQGDLYVCKKGEVSSSTQSGYTTLTSSKTSSAQNSGSSLGSPSSSSASSSRSHAGAVAIASAASANIFGFVAAVALALL